MKENTLPTSLQPFGKKIKLEIIEGQLKKRIKRSAAKFCEFGSKTPCLTRCPFPREVLQKPSTFN